MLFTSRPSNYSTVYCVLVSDGHQRLLGLVSDEERGIHDTFTGVSRDHIHRHLRHLLEMKAAETGKVSLTTKSN